MVVLSSEEDMSNSDKSVERSGTFALEEFTKLDDSHKREKTRSHNFMLKCNHCDKVMVNTSTKYHLKTQHREVFEVV